MRFSNIVIIYAMMGIVVVASGAVPASEIGIVDNFVDIDPDEGTVEDSNNITNEEETGITDNIIEPVQNALNTISGGAAMAIWNGIDSLIGAYAWPLTVTAYVGAPWRIQAFASLFVISFTFGVIKSAGQII